MQGVSLLGNIREILLERSRYARLLVVRQLKRLLLLARWPFEVQNATMVEDTQAYQQSNRDRVSGEILPLVCLLLISSLIETPDGCRWASFWLAVLPLSENSKLHDLKGRWFRYSLTCLQHSPENESGDPGTRCCDDHLYRSDDHKWRHSAVDEHKVAIPWKTWISCDPVLAMSNKHYGSVFTMSKKCVNTAEQQADAFYLFQS